MSGTNPDRYDGVPRIGVIISFQARADLGESYEQAYREGLEFAAEAERCGVDDIWLTEHHLEQDGYCPSPVVASAAVAAVTRRAQIGQAIAIAPLQGHPLRLAEDLAVVDNLSGGRVEIGLGQGYRPAEFDAFGLSYTDRTKMFEEVLDVVDLAWRGAEFDYDGAIYRVRAGRLRPPPVRPGPPPLWIGAAAPRSRARVVRRRAGLILSPLIEFEHAARQFDAFDAEALSHGVGPLPHAVVREVVVGDDVQDALSGVQQYLDHTYRVQYAPERTGLTYRDPVTGHTRRLTSNDPYYLSEDFVRARWCFGSPEQCADTIVGWVGRTRVERLICQPKMPGRPLAEAVRDVERLMTEVMPIVRRKLAP